MNSITIAEQGGQPNLKFKFQEFSRSISGVFMKFPGVAMG